MVEQIIAGSIRTGANPRRLFRPEEMAEITESIRAQGLIQPITVRPVDVNGTREFHLVAGERRLRAFREVFGLEAPIPAFVREMSDSEADAAAMTENMIRADMTPVEEAEAAAKVLGACKGDRDDAAKRLGWSRPTLDKRLALMYASDDVRAALQDGKILLGHAELLAACRKESQDAALKHLLEQPKLMPVAGLKSFLELKALNLDAAIFDKSECAACHHNSANQASLFAESIAGGRCTNKSCFDTKTEEHITKTAEGLKDEFQVVRVVRPGENLTVIPLKAEGQRGVGEVQAKACRTCVNFGAVVSMAPDKLGNVYKDICMDVACNKAKVDANQKAIQEAEATQAKADKAAKAPAKTAKSTDASAPEADGKSERVAEAASEKEDAAAPLTSEPSNRVKEFRERLWRMIFKRAVLKADAPTNRLVLLSILVSHSSYISSTEAKADIAKAFGDGLKSTNVTEAFVSARDVLADPAKLAQALAYLAANVTTLMPLSDVKGLMVAMDIKVADYWKLSKSFLELLTKNEADAVADELGIKAAIGDGYSKVRNGSKEEFIDALLGVKDFQYEGRVPSFMEFTAKA